MQEDQRKAEAKRIGSLIRQWRMRQGWTQDDLGKVAHIGQTYISQLECGEMVPTEQTSRQLAYALGVPPETFAARIADHRYQPRSRAKKDETRTPFGKMINQARMQKQWTREMLARKSHLTPTQIETYEDGKHMPRDREIVEVLADVLEIEPDTLLQVWHPPHKTSDRVDGDLVKCTRCHKKKPLTEFHKDSQASNGYQPRCKQCREELRQIKKLLQEGWTHQVSDGLLQGQPARIATAPRKVYRPLHDDYPDPVWTEFRDLHQQWFPAGRLVPLQKVREQD